MPLDLAMISLTLKAQETKEKLNKLDFIKIKNYYQQTLESERQPTKWKKNSCKSCL